MNKIKYIEEHEKELCDLLVECFMNSIKSRGGLMYEIYFVNGKFEPLELVWSGNSYRAPHKAYDKANMLVDGIGIKKNDFEGYFGKEELTQEDLEAEKERFIEWERDKIFTDICIDADREAFANE